ncbi:hypothetical protein Ae201684P_021130 [Aphanomyces euteiches]|uniref:PH domain-containing protein n=1 Tax=Aphanomyces euteiches TaxID=100861 RepID=A0A6G0WH76_9STRA|nr:hypothetical protein Ae201684_015273 [Aphanomyces euteiches]KAH9071993.1 hypothetical protein Ae201684P_021130 [Aphanomyces euteiches]
MLVKEGTMSKQGARPSLFGGYNWKRRYFRLTEAELSYFNPTDGSLKGTIYLHDCGRDALEVMPHEPKSEASESPRWRLAIQTPQRLLLLEICSEKEMQAWAQAIYSVLEINERKMNTHCNL